MQFALRRRLPADSCFQFPTGDVIDQSVAEQTVVELYELAFQRKPRDRELVQWSRALASGAVSLRDLMQKCRESDEYQKLHGVKTRFPVGHFHSPVVDPATLGDYYARERHIGPREISGIDLDTGAMRALWLQMLSWVQKTPFEDKANDKNRYCYSGGPYPWGDGIALRMMIGHCRPRRVIEVGSGYSSACMLDSAEQAGLSDFKLTCIEPNTARLKSLLGAGDEKRVTILEDYVQNVPASIVDVLEPNDILFIDSTHVVKTGSDVHYELFYLIPRLKPGVIVHFHDVGFPFEYPPRWVIEENFSWNEAYFVRSFLMYNKRFRIKFWNSLFAREFRGEIRREFPTFLKNPGSSIWLECVGGD